VCPSAVRSRVYPSRLARRQTSRPRPRRKEYRRTWRPDRCLPKEVGETKIITREDSPRVARNPKRGFQHRRLGAWAWGRGCACAARGEETSGTLAATNKSSEQRRDHQQPETHTHSHRCQRQKALFDNGVLGQEAQRRPIGNSPRLKITVGIYQRPVIRQRSRSSSPWNAFRHLYGASRIVPCMSARGCIATVNDRIARAKKQHRF